MNTTELAVGGTLIEKLKASLLEQKSLILNKKSEFLAEQSTQLLKGDEVEIASTDLVNSISIHLLERDLKSLILIDKALSKIEKGSFGECESCSAEINAKRLEAHPFTSLCIECMEELEANKKSKLQ